MGRGVSAGRCGWGLPGHLEGPEFHDPPFSRGLALPRVTSFPLCLLPGRSTLSRCCNAPSFLFTTQKNTPLGTKLKYEVDTSGIYHINQEIFRMFPKVPLWAGPPGRGKGATPRGPKWLCPQGMASTCWALCTHRPGSGRLLVDHPSTVNANWLLFE